MTTDPFTAVLDVPVAGGSLRVALAGPAGGRPVVLAPHGITASHRSWAAVARHLGDDVTFLAPDLRGRGASAGLPGPYGIDAHVADLLAVLDHVGAVNATVAGHSMGAFVAARFAQLHPERAAAAVLVDGGVPLPVPEGADPDAVIDAVLGPAVARLRQTFPSRQAYREFWQAHPAFAGAWSDDAEAYVDYDLMGEEPELRSRVSEEAVRADGRDLLVNEAVREAVRAAACPVVLLRAPRGLMNEDNPLVPEAVARAYCEQVPGMVAEEVADTNHYLITIADREAAVVADRIRAACGA